MNVDCRDVSQLDNNDGDDDDGHLHQLTDVAITQDYTETKNLSFPSGESSTGGGSSSESAKATKSRADVEVARDVKSPSRTTPISNRRVAQQRAEEALRRIDAANAAANELRRQLMQEREELARTQQEMARWRATIDQEEKMLDERIKLHRTLTQKKRQFEIEQDRLNLESAPRGPVKPVTITRSNLAADAPRCRLSCSSQSDVTAEGTESQN